MLWEIQDKINSDQRIVEESVRLMIEKRETGGPGEFGSMQTAAEVLDALKSQFGPEVADLLKVAVERSEGQQTATAPVQQIDNSFGEAEKSIAAFRKRPQERR